MTKATIKQVLLEAKRTGQPQKLGYLTVTHSSARTMNSETKVANRWAKDRYVTRYVDGTIATNHEGSIRTAVDVLYRLLQRDTAMAKVR